MHTTFSEGNIEAYLNYTSAYIEYQTEYEGREALTDRLSKSLNEKLNKN
jgi:hypothetical protein